MSGCFASSLSRACVDILSVAPLQSGPFQTPDPFLFCVYHKDEYPAGDEKMQAPKRGNGADFAPGPYRMYHGERIPGFPQHPHRGFETVTATITGVIDHTDSHGNAGRYGQGDLQWMTAGSGVVHGEMFPLVNDDKPNPTRFFQIWLNLPAKNKMVEPAFVMHWERNIPHVKSPDGKVSPYTRTWLLIFKHLSNNVSVNKVDITVWAGAFLDQQALSPPPNSWAADPANDVGIWLLSLQPGGYVTLPKAQATSNRMAYFIEGSEVEIGGDRLKRHSILELKPNSIDLHNPSGGLVELLVLQGKPISEPVAQHGPFVMNTDKEIKQAFSDYRATEFGGWPWQNDAVVFPRDKPRFSLMNGTEETAPPLRHSGS